MKKYLLPLIIVLVIVAAIIITKSNRRVSEIKTGSLMRTEDISSSEVIWPDIFITGTEDFQNTRRDSARAVALGMTGWDCAAMEEPPDKFGEGMIVIGRFLGCSPEYDSLKALAIERGYLSE